MQSLPPTVIPSTGLPHNPDDADVQSRMPSICVDYLSHDWAEEDVWASWRSMTKMKNEVSNGIRLENASWRTWWKQRNKLKTISPETLNWLKDSDVTWLYGPLHTAVEAVPPPKIASAEERLNLVSSGGKKTILKHRTISEMLTTPTPSSPVLEGLDFATPEDSDSDNDIGNARPQLLQTKSDTHIANRGPLRRLSPPRNNRSPLPSPEVEPSVNKRHISFNTFVEQCISLDEPTNVYPDKPESDSEEEDDDDVLEMRSSSSASSLSSRPTFSRNSSNSSSNEHFTIAHIAPTVLKSNEALPSPYPAVVFVPPPASSPAATHYDSSGFDIPTPNSEPATWSDDDDDFNDYFSGPDKSGTTKPTRGASVASGAGSVGHYESSGPSSSVASSSRSSQANNAPAPRRGASIGSAAPASTRPGASIGSASSSGNSSGTAIGSSSESISSSPRLAHQPARSILKNRQGTSDSPKPDSSPYFPNDEDLEHAAVIHSNTKQNTKENAASTSASLPPISGSTGHTPVSELPRAPHVADQTTTTRGRSIARSGSSSALDRVPSRGSSTSLGSSVSPSHPSTSAPAAQLPQSHASAPSPPPTAGRAARPPSIKTTKDTGAPLRVETPAGGASVGGGSDPNSPLIPSNDSDGSDLSRRAGDDLWAVAAERRRIEDEKRSNESLDLLREAMEQDRAKAEEDARKAAEDTVGLGAIGQQLESLGLGGGSAAPSKAELDEEGRYSLDEKDGNVYEYTESTNPTPNSSPLISMRPLHGQDSSAASLPHAHTKSPPTTSPASPTSTSATLSLQRTSSNLSIHNNSSGNDHSNHHPTLHRSSSSSSGHNQTVSGSTGGEQHGHQRDSSSASGKSAGGVVATARDLLGALWGIGKEGGGEGGGASASAASSGSQSTSKAT